jgi:hypothetical protein
MEKAMRLAGLSRTLMISDTGTMTPSRPSWLRAAATTLAATIGGVWMRRIMAIGLFGAALSAQGAGMDQLAGQPADISSSAYHYRADRKPAENPPEAWILMIQYAGLPYTSPVQADHPLVQKALCGLLWEEVRRVKRIELVWPADAKDKPLASEVALAHLDSDDKNSHTWWNPRTVKEAASPEVSADGRTYAFSLPADTWGVVAAIKGEKNARQFAVPAMRAYGSETWKKLDIEIEWGFESSRAKEDYDGRLEGYDALLGDVQPLAGDAATKMTGAAQWKSSGGQAGRRGVRLSALYIGVSPPPRVWPYTTVAEDVPRSLINVWTKSGSFTFQVSDLDRGPIYASEYGFYVRSAAHRPTAAEFVRDLAGRKLQTIRQQTRQHPEPTWEQAVRAFHPQIKELPPHPKPDFEPPMQVEVPCERLTAQWKLGAWHILRHTAKTPEGKWFFNDHPFGILAAETYMILRALDLQGMHKEAADGLDQWLSLPMQPKAQPGGWQGTPRCPDDRPYGNFSSGHGCFTHAVGPKGVGGHMDGAHCFGPGAIAYTMCEHWGLTADTAWLKTHAPRMKANADWVLGQRKLLAEILPNGQQLASRGLQPAHVVTPDSGSMHMQFYETEAYYWLAVQRMADMLATIDPVEARRYAEAAQAYRRDLVAAAQRSIALMPVTQVRDGTFRSFIPFSPYVRGFASTAWGWKRCHGHVGAIYWDTVQSATPLISPSGLLPFDDPRVQGHLDVLEDRLLLENGKVKARKSDFDPDRDWFAHASFQYQCGLERHANLHLDADDIPCFLRSFYNQYAVDILPGNGYTFREHTTGGPPDKIYEESCFLERFRNMLAMEIGDALWLARGTPRAWLAQGKKISVKNAPTHFGTLAYEIVSDADNGKISATIEIPSRKPPTEVVIRFRHPNATPIKSVVVNGGPWTEFAKDKETIVLKGLAGRVAITAGY